MKHKKLYIKLISFLLILIYTLPVNAVATSSTISKWPYYDLNIASQSAYVIDADSSIVLYSYNPTKRLYPASLAKIMTALVVFDKANGNYDDLVTFSYNAVTKDIDKNSVTIGASAGDQLSVKDCLYCLLLPSANDAANALAEHYAGSINDFALLMNEKAENLGLENTHFVNPSGLHNDNQYSSAEDMAKILQCAMTYPIFMQISSSLSYRHAPIRKYKNPENSNNVVLNTNSILSSGSKYYYNKAVAGKTGHTNAAGYNLAVCARNNGMNLVCVTLGAKTEKDRFDDTKKLCEFHFDNYKSLKIKDIDKRFDDSISSLSINDVHLIESLNITCSDSAHITLPKNIDENSIKSVLSFQVDDIYNKYAIGSLHYYLDDVLVGKCTLEGRNIDNIEEIYTSHLNLSNPLSSNDDDAIKNNNSNSTTNNLLISINDDGELVLSNTLITLIIIIIILIVAIVFISFIYINIFNNPNIPFAKFLFRLRRKFRR